MDTGLFLIILTVIFTIIYMFNRIMNYIEYRPMHVKKKDIINLEDEE